MNPIDTWGDLEKQIANAFHEKWKDELDDVNHLDGIIFTLDYLRDKKLFDYKQYKKYWEETKVLATETHHKLNSDKAIKYVRDIIKDFRQRKEKE